MKVKEFCTRDVRTCRASDSLDRAGGLFWEADCGFLPVVDDEKRLIGVLTDRDVCIAVTTRALPAHAITVGEVMNEHPDVCGLDDDVFSAIEAMSRRRVRRIPIVDARGRLEGVLSLADLARAAKSHALAEPGRPTFEDLAHLLRAICGPRRRRERRRVRLDPFMA